MSQMDYMKNFKDVTDQLLCIDLSQDKKIVILEIEELLDKRDQIIKAFELEKEHDLEVTYLNEVIRLNLKLETIFEEIMLDIDEGLKKTLNEKALSSKKKKAQRGYFNSGHQNDGYFIDKKK